MKLFGALVLALAFAQQAEARPAHWYKDPKWWVGDFFVAASIGADAHSTVNRSNKLTEGNRFLGRNPSRQKVIGVAVLSMGLQTTYHALAWHWSVGEDDTKGWRILGYTAIPVECVSIYGLAGAVHNYRLELPKMQAKPSMVKVKN